MSWGDPRGVAVASESWWKSVSPMGLMIVFCMICSSALLGSAAEYIGWGMLTSRLRKLEADGEDTGRGIQRVAAAGREKGWIS